MMSFPDHPTQTIKLNLREAWRNESAEIAEYQRGSGPLRLFSLIPDVRGGQKERDLSNIIQPVSGGLFSPG